MQTAVCWIVALVWSQVPPPQAPDEALAALRARRAAILTAEASSLDALARRLERDGKTEIAATVRQAIERIPEGDGATRFVPLAELVPAAEPEPAPDDPWRNDLRSARDAAATALFELAGKAARANPPSFALADACLRGVLARQPDHPEARRLLGFVPDRGGWATPWAAKQLAAGKVPHPVYGWVEAGWIPNLVRGELPAPRLPNDPNPDRWLPAEEADALRRRWEDGWRISTEHFDIQANVRLAEAIDFARKLELLHELFFALMADLIGPELPLALRYKNPKLVPKSDSKRYRVNYFGSEDEYLGYLTRRYGARLKGSLGFYLPPKDARRNGEPPTSHFFRDPNGQLPEVATLFHEASHQLLFESAGPEAHTRNDGNYWVFEGLGTYFETLDVRPDGTLEVGGPIGARLAEARRRLVDRNEFLPTRRFVAMGPSAFEDERSIHLHYLQAIALATYLLQHDGGADRAAFIDYARDAYRGRLRRGGSRALDVRLGISYEELDRRVKAYLAANLPAAGGR